MIDLCSRSSRALGYREQLPRSGAMVAHDVSCITTPTNPRLSLFTTQLFRLTKPDPF